VKQSNRDDLPLDQRKAYLPILMRMPLTLDFLRLA